VKGREWSAFGDDGDLIAGKAGLEATAILTFENLIDHFELLKRRGINGEADMKVFYVRDREEFRNNGLGTLLTSVENSNY